MTPIFAAAARDHGVIDTRPLRTLGLVSRTSYATADEQPEYMDTCRGCKEWTPVHDIDADGLCWRCGS